MRCLLPGHHQPPNHTPKPCTTPTGNTAAEAIIKGRLPLTAQNTMEVSHAAYDKVKVTTSDVSVVKSIISRLRKRLSIATPWCAEGDERSRGGSKTPVMRRCTEYAKHHSSDDGDEDGDKQGTQIVIGIGRVEQVFHPVFLRRVHRWLQSRLRDA